MTRDAYIFMQQYIHSCDNSKKKEKGLRGYNALCKVSYPLKVMMKGMRSVWSAGKYITIDESMIRYMRRAVGYVQYTPAKPIKHGIKVFAVCCAISAVILAFEVFVGKEDEDRDNTALGVCDQLVKDVELTSARGRVLYINNYYTLVKLAKHMFLEYG